MNTISSFSNIFKLTAVAAAIVFVTGCSDSDGLSPAEEAQQKLEAAQKELVAKQAATDTATTAVTTAVAASVEKGTVVTVVDGYATGCSVRSGTLAALPTGGLGQYIFAGKPTAVINATGCTDSHTGITLPPLSTPAPTTTTATALDFVNITPVTTVIQSFIAAGSTPEDPIATNNPVLQKAATQIVAIAKIAQNNSTTATVTADPIKAITEAAKTITTAGTTTATLANAVRTTVPAAVQAAVETAATEVKAAIAASTSVQQMAQVAKVANNAATNVASLSTAAAINTAAATQTVVSTGIVTPAAVTTANIAAVVTTVTAQIVAAVKAGNTEIVTAIAAQAAPTQAAAVVTAVQEVAKAVETVKAAETVVIQTGTGSAG